MPRRILSRLEALTRNPIWIRQSRFIKVITRDCNSAVTTNKLNAQMFPNTFFAFFCVELSMESSSDLLDFETEPCLMMESVLEDVPLPDTYSHNMVSSSDSLRRALSFPETVDEHNTRKSKLSDECTSLTNLTQAILHRRKASIFCRIEFRILGKYLFVNVVLFAGGR